MSADTPQDQQAKAQRRLRLVSDNKVPSTPVGRFVAAERARIGAITVVPMACACQLGADGEVTVMCGRHYRAALRMHLAWLLSGSR